MKKHLHFLIKRRMTYVGRSDSFMKLYRNLCYTIFIRINRDLQADFRCLQLLVLKVQLNDYLDIREHFLTYDVLYIGSTAKLSKYYVFVFMPVTLIVAAATFI